MAGICIKSAVAGPFGIEEPPSPGEDVNPLFQRIAYLYSQNTEVSLSVVASGGNLGTLGSDTRRIAGVLVHLLLPPKVVLQAKVLHPTYQQSQVVRLLVSVKR